MINCFQFRFNLAFKFNLRRCSVAVPHHVVHRRRGRVVQVESVNPASKASGINCLKLDYHKLLSNFAFKFNLRLYDVVACAPVDLVTRGVKAGTYTRSR
jgi:hypothetical protein